MAVVLAAVLAGGLVSGCAAGGGVHVDGFHVTAAQRAACRTFLDALPAKVGDQPRRHVSGSSYAVAWGDPAIVLRCGVPLPKDFPSAPCITRNGIGWSVPLAQANDSSSDAVMTLAFRSPVVQVYLPAQYRPNGPAEVMADLDADVRAHTAGHGHCS